LAVVVGFPELEPRPLAGDLRQDLPEVKWDEAWFRLQSASPELSAAQAKLAAARATVQKAFADRCQNWDVEAGYAHDNATGFDTGGLTVVMPVPLFNRNQGAIRQAQAEFTAAQAEVGRVALDLRNRLALVFERYSNARELVERYQNNILPNARESVDLTSSRYRAGESNYPALLLAQRTLLQKNIILSHSAGVGPLLDDSIVRLTMVLKLASLLQGGSPLLLKEKERDVTDHSHVVDEDIALAPARKPAKKDRKSHDEAPDHEGRGPASRRLTDEDAETYRLEVGYVHGVKPGNIRGFMAHPEIDGALVGGASLEPEDFALIVKYR
jgi:hypothetical protein